MLNKNSDDTPRQQRDNPWPEIFERWQRGESVEALAQAFGRSPVTIRDRCRRVEIFFPPGTPLCLRAQLGRRLADAHATLITGSALEAERQAKAVLAILRAVRALESATMDRQKTTPARPSREPEMACDYGDPRAELERRVLRLIDVESARRQGQGQSRRAEDDPQNADLAGDKAGECLDELGQA